MAAVALFRKASSPHALPIAMTGVRMGDRILQLGCGNGPLMAALAGKVGLSGRACLVVPAGDSLALAHQATERAGVLVEVESWDGSRLPFPDETFNLVVLGQAGLPASVELVGLLCEARRTLEARGRVVIIDAFGPPPGLFRFLHRPSPAEGARRSEASLAALREAGFGAVRRLAERDGMAFTEALK